jgi:hypothetical protein
LLSKKRVTDNSFIGNSIDYKIKAPLRGVGGLFFIFLL